MGYIPLLELDYTFFMVTTAFGAFLFVSLFSLSAAVLLSLLDRIVILAVTIYFAVVFFAAAMFKAP
jgi:hypothetical protein